MEPVIEGMLVAGNARLGFWPKLLKRLAVRVVNLVVKDFQMLSDSKEQDIEEKLRMTHGFGCFEGDQTAKAGFDITDQDTKFKAFVQSNDGVVQCLVFFSQLFGEFLSQIER